MFGWEHGCAGFWWICPLFIIIMIIACIFLMRRCFCMSGGRYPEERIRKSSDDSAMEILNKRYALGEIDHEKYEEMRNNISRDEKMARNG